MIATLRCCIFTIIIIIIVIIHQHAVIVVVAGGDDAVAQVAFRLQPLLNLPTVDAVFPGGGALITLAISIVSVGIQHL